MIRRTIKEHLDKEKRLRPQGIKVLSLFFIDAGGASTASTTPTATR
jgi:restriction endonuclease